jgi:hypothetical protein
VEALIHRVRVARTRASIAAYHNMEAPVVEVGHDGGMLRKVAFFSVALTALALVHCGSSSSSGPASGGDASFANDSAPDATSDTSLPSEVGAAVEAGLDAETEGSADATRPDVDAAHCYDGIEDADETDVDCGGVDCDNLPLPQRCPFGAFCLTAFDCQTGLCGSSFVCLTKPKGDRCSGDAQCTSGACVKSVCCATSCADMGPGSCGTDGNCLWTGASCEYYSNTTPCGGSCGSGMVTVAGHCNGSGTCNPGTTSACAQHLGCNGSICVTSCTPGTTTGCAPGFKCNAIGNGCS